MPNYLVRFEVHGTAEISVDAKTELEAYDIATDELWDSYDDVGVFNLDDSQCIGVEILK